MFVYYTDPEEYLAHYGVKGMKWGVRRYQNYDGTRTQKGLERYKAASKKYESAKADYKAGKGNRKNVKNAKRQLSKEYDTLKRANRADEGQKLRAYYGLSRTAPR